MNKTGGDKFGHHCQFNFCPGCGMKWENDSNEFGCWNCGFVNKLYDIWKFCDTEQRLNWDAEEEYIQGKIIAQREIQHMINGKCSEIKEPQKCD